jgi:hypothetical protein
MGKTFDSFDVVVYLIYTESVTSVTPLIIIFHSGQVHIIGHIFPGGSSCLKAWSWNYYKIVNR